MFRKGGVGMIRRGIDGYTNVGLNPLRFDMEGPHAVLRITAYAWHADLTFKREVPRPVDGIDPSIFQASWDRRSFDAFMDAYYRLSDEKDWDAPCPALMGKTEALKAIDYAPTDKYAMISQRGLTAFSGDVFENTHYGELEGKYSKVPYLRATAENYHWWGVFYARP
jgi:hypothetical protein